MKLSLNIKELLFGPAETPKKVIDFFMKHSDFITGMGVFAFPFEVTNYRVYQLSWFSDEDAIASDWAVVGQDLRNAMNQFEGNYVKR